MVKTASTMLELGTPMPAFSLPDAVSGKTFNDQSLDGDQPTLVMFICNHCPFVKHLRTQLAEFAKEYRSKGMNIVAISSNDATEYPDDSPEMMKKEAAEMGYEFPYLYDESQEVAKAFTAACTPDFFLFDSFGKLAYRGQFDDSRPGGDLPVTGGDLREACTYVIAGSPAQPDQKPSLGCNIKWKDAPEYFTGQPAV